MGSFDLIFLVLVNGTMTVLLGLTFKPLLKAPVFQQVDTDNFNRCHINDKDLDRCLATTIENAIKTIGSYGIPTMNLPSVDPVKIASVEISAGTTAVNLVQKYSDVKIYGLSDISVDSAHLDLNGKILSFTTYHPEIRQEAKYSINGKIFVVPVRGKGNSKILLYEPSLKHTLRFKGETRNNMEYFSIANYTLNISIRGAHLEFQNLFDGDEELAQNILKIINDNWDMMFDDVREDVEKSSAEVCKMLAKNLFDSVPVDQIFLA
ncbi:unnamed protein product [Phaedon cochleariae]|uniref:Protein takeout n=1 Tax=Phaedon cochleariae TaxID=80249 RepID=A0A9N9SJN3_PHACE|nr:unnamed protein product [Phaedon cochleariae]